MRSRRGSVPISYDLLSPTRASSGGDNRHLGHPRPIDVKTVSHARRTGPTRNQIPWRIDKPPLNLKLEQLRIVTLGSAHIGRVRRQNDTVDSISLRSIRRSLRSFLYRCRFCSIVVSSLMLAVRSIGVGGALISSGCRIHGPSVNWSMWPFAAFV